MISRCSEPPISRLLPDIHIYIHIYIELIFYTWENIKFLLREKKRHFFFFWWRFLHSSKIMTFLCREWCNIQLLLYGEHPQRNRESDDDTAFETLITSQVTECVRAISRITRLFLFFVKVWKGYIFTEKSSVKSWIHFIYLLLSGAGMPK